MRNSRIRQKIRRLQKRLRHSDSQSSSESKSDSEHEFSPPRKRTRRRIISSDSSEPDDNTNEVAQEIQEEVTDDILSILGEDPTINEEFSTDIHSHIAVRWNNILQKGIKKEIRSDLVKKYLPPANCRYIQPPKLNDEIKAAVQENSVKRDARLEHKQVQLGAGITCVGKAIDIALKIPDKDLRDQVIKCLGEGGQILTDLHYLETTTRRSLLMQGLNKNTKEAIKDIFRDNLLFGEGLSEKLKATRACTKSAVDLKIKVPKTSTQRGRPDLRNAAGFPSSTQSLNWRGSSRRTGLASVNLAGGAYREQRERRPTAAPPRRPQASQRPCNNPPYIPWNETPSTQITVFDGRSFIRKAFLNRGAPVEALDILLDSFSTNTFKQYQSALKEWDVYCRTHNYDCFNSSIRIILEFLTFVYYKGAKYGTVNYYKSALALILGSQMNDDLITRFLKGVYRNVPPTPKYDSTWDPSIVLQKLETLNNSELTLEHLSKKLITLLALVTAHRVQTLSLIKISNIEINETKIIIKIPDLIKTSSVNRSQPLLILPFFIQRPEICPAKTLITYLKKSGSLRPANVDFLFISFKKPHSGVSSQTLSRWIKCILSESGVNTEVFTAHSTRHAATSAANRSGVNLQLIRKAAGWSGSSKVFANFYNRPVIENTLDDEFGRSILNS